MLKRLFTYLKSLRIVSVKVSSDNIVNDASNEQNSNILSSSQTFDNVEWKSEHRQDTFNMYKHPNFDKRVLDMVKLLDADQYYLVTNPDKVNPAKLLEEADYQFFIFNYLNQNSCMYEYIFWTNMTSSHARDIADEVIEWKTAQEDIEWEIRKLL